MSIECFNGRGGYSMNSSPGRGPGFGYGPGPGRGFGPGHGYGYGYRPGYGHGPGPGYGPGPGPGYGHRYHWNQPIYNSSSYGVLPYYEYPPCTCHPSDTYAQCQRRQYECNFN